MKALSGVAMLGIGFLLCSGSPARAQLGELGGAVEKGAADAAKQELMKQAGLPTPGSPAVTPAAAAGAETAPAGAPTAAAPAEAAPAATPAAPDAPADE